MPDQQSQRSPEETLAGILEHLENLDHRDKLRTRAAMFRSLMHFVYMGIILWGSWYVFVNSDKIMSGLMEKSTQMAINLLQGQSNTSGNSATQTGGELNVNQQFIEELTRKATEQALEAQRKQQEQ